MGLMTESDHVRPNKTDSWISRKVHPLHIAREVETQIPKTDFWEKSEREAFKQSETDPYA